MINYYITEEAEIDLNEIYIYTQSNFNHKQATIYLKKIESTLERLSKNPKLGIEKSEIRKGLFGITESEHLILYRMLSNEIRIIRVIHGSKDIPKEV